MNPHDNQFIDWNVAKFFNECVDREFRPNAIANEIDSLREQQEYQFYVQQGLETRLREESERPRTSKLYVQRSQEPSPERKAAIIDLVNTLESNSKDDSFSMSEITALVLFTGLIASIVGGLMFVVLP